MLLRLAWLEHPQLCRDSSEGPYKLAEQAMPVEQDDETTGRTKVTSTNVL